MSLASQVSLLATRTATEFKSVRTAIALLAPKAAPALTGAATLDGQALVKTNDARLNASINGSFKAPVRAMATSNITLSGAQTINGVAVVAGDRVLVKNQTISAESGIYEVAAGAWSRALDADTSAKMDNAFVAVNEGTFREVLHTSFSGADILGTSPVLWYRVLDYSLINVPNGFPQLNGQSLISSYNMGDNVSGFQNVDEGRFLNAYGQFVNLQNIKSSVAVVAVADIVLSGAQTIDGIGVVVGDHVLVVGQSAPANNGIYVVAAGAWSRRSDALDGTRLGTALVSPAYGTLAGSRWYLLNNVSMSVGTTDQRWVRSADAAADDMTAVEIFQNTTITLDLSLGRVFIHFLATSVGSITFTNVPPAGSTKRLVTVTYIVNQGGSAYSVAAPTSTIWLGAGPPVQVANKRCVFTYQTYDGGSSWMASAVVQV